MQFTALISSLYNYFRQKREKKLRRLKDDLLDEAIMRNSKLFFELAVLSYVLSKILSRPRFLTEQYVKELNEIERLLGRILAGIGKKTDAELLSIIHEIENVIKHLEREDQRYFRDLITKGRLKMASTMYAKGISLGTAASMSGLDKQEIQEYAGSTLMFDRVKEEIDIKERIKRARRLLE
ncbi:MAG: hypothetical protein QXT45_02150 [Candidatus Bilamarchaeaceae archaeon]